MDIEDRSAKIVSLAHAILQEPPSAPTSRHYSLKSLVLTALLSMAGTAGVTQQVAEQIRPLNRYEKTELIALIHYVAKQHQTTPAAIEADLLQEYAAQSLDDLRRAELPAARLHLQQQITPPLTR